MTATFAERRAEIDRLTRRWRVEPAYDAAWQLMRDFPGEPDAYTLFNMLICITNNGGGRMGGLRKASPRLLDQAISTIPGFPGSLHHGDMLRDMLIGLARFPIGDNLDMARRLPKLIRKMHANDPNRLAGLTDGEARLAAAEGSLDYAYGLHAEAHRAWEELGDAADPNWVHFNLVHWLRVSIRVYGRNSRGTQQILRHLHGDRPPGAHSATAKCRSSACRWSVCEPTAGWKRTACDAVPPLIMFGPGAGHNLLCNLSSASGDNCLSHNIIL